MFFTTDINKVLQAENPKEYLKGVRREILPRLEGMVKNAATIIKEIFDVDVFETMMVKKDQDRSFQIHDDAENDESTLQQIREVYYGLQGQKQKEEYKHNTKRHVYKRNPSFLYFHEADGMLSVKFDPFSYGHDDNYVVLVKQFFFDNWKGIRDFLPPVSESRVKACEIDDIDAFLKKTEDNDDDGYIYFFFAVPPVALPEGINDIRDLEDTVRNQILRFYETNFAYLYPFLHVCVCLAKGESTDSFFVMLEKLKHLYKQAENLLPI